MNNLKFRAWHKELKEMRSVHAINWMQFESCNVMVSPNESEAWVYWASKNIELMQWTGLKDAMGKDVYEGDIIVANHPSHTWKGSMFIKQNIEEGRWELTPASNCKKNVRIFNKYNVYEQKLEIVGNIYENPELLEQK